MPNAKESLNKNNTLIFEKNGATECERNIKYKIMF